MKFYSEITNKLYPSEDALNADEQAFLGCDSCDGDIDCAECEAAAPEAQEVDKSVNKNLEPPTRKQLAENVNKADALVKEAYNNLDIAKKAVEDLSNEYLKTVDSIMKPAEQGVRDAEKIRYDAMKQFNDAYGPYTKTLTGVDAADEFFRAINRFDQMQRDMWKRFWL